MGLRRRYTRNGDSFPSPNPILIGLAVVALGAGIFRARSALEEFLILPPHQRRAEQLGRHFDVTTAALERAVSECALALVAAALLVSMSLLLPALRRRALSKRAYAWVVPSRFGTTAFGIGCVACAAFLEARTEPLAAEAGDPIPMTHMFANASLGFLPELGVRGLGPDSLVEAPWLVLGTSGATVDGATVKDAAECATILRNKSMLYQQLSPGQPAPTALLMTVMPNVDAHELFTYLSATHAGGSTGRKTVYFVLSDMRTLDRPIFGKLVGVRFTGLRAQLSESREACDPDHKAVLAPGGGKVGAETLLKSWLVQPRRPCLVVTESW